MRRQKMFLFMLDFINKLIFKASEIVSTLYVENIPEVT